MPDPYNSPNLTPISIAEEEEAGGWERTSIWGIPSTLGKTETGMKFATNLTTGSSLTSQLMDVILRNIAIGFAHLRSRFMGSLKSHWFAGVLPTGVTVRESSGFLIVFSSITRASPNIRKDGGKEQRSDTTKIGGGAIATTTQRRSS